MWQPGEGMEGGGGVWVFTTDNKSAVQNNSSSKLLAVFHPAFRSNGRPCMAIDQI